MVKLLSNHSTPEPKSRSVAVRDSGPVSRPEPTRTSVPDEYSDAVRLWPHARSERISGYISHEPERPKLNYRPDIQTVVLEPRERRVEQPPAVTAVEPPALLTDQSSRGVATTTEPSEGIVERCMSRAVEYEPGDNMKALTFAFAVGGGLLLIYVIIALIGGILTGGPSASRQRFHDRFGYDRDSGRPVWSDTRGGYGRSDYDY